MAGGKEPAAIKVGTQDVKAVYAGTKKVWPAEIDPPRPNLPDYVYSREPVQRSMYPDGCSTADPDGCYLSKQCFLRNEDIIPDILHFVKNGEMMQTNIGRAANPFSSSMVQDDEALTDFHIEPNMISSVIKELKLHKASGISGINAKILKIFSAMLVSPLVQIYNKAIELYQPFNQSF